MANVQLVRTRQTYATTTINELQSIQLVQTMLHGALSTLTYLRELFPEKAFENRYYEMRETPLPYADFAAARMPSLKGEADQHSTRLPVLLRQRSKRADLFLDWLEKGVFPELDSGELRAVQLLIHPDKKSRDAVLETYTFTVHYTISEDGRRTPSGLAASASGDTAATAKAANTALQQLLRSVSSLCQDLPVLPAGRLISMALIYESDKGKAKSVEGFVPCEGDNLSFAKAKGWDTYTKSLEFTTGYHDTLLKITGLQNDQSSHEGQTQEVPNCVKFTSNVSRYNDVQLMPPPPVPHQKGTSRRNTISLQLEGLERKQVAALKRSGKQDVERWSSLVNSMNGHLKDMMQPEQITQGDTQTQGGFQHFAFEDAVTVTPTTIRAPSVQSSHLRTPITTDTFPLLAETQNNIASRRLYLTQTASALANKAGGRTQSGQMVLCQCGFGKDEGDMVQCSYCSTWQHLHCYGYTGDVDPRLPEEHVCYWCLLGDTDVENYNLLQVLALRRRAMFHVAKSGLRTRTDLSKAMNIGQDQAGELHAMVKKSRFVTDAEKSHKPGYRATGKALFVPVQDDATMRRMLDTYFNPMTYVGHHYEARTSNELIESQMRTNMRLIRAMAATDLPQPATPHRSKSKAIAASHDGDHNSAPPTPLPSAFDMRTSQEFMATSETLQETPTIKTRRFTQKSKRALESEETEASNSKRFAAPKRHQPQFTSLRSTTMIDANDKSSPYLRQ